MTKTIALALALASTATLASANSYIGFEGTQDRDFQIELDLVTSEVAAVVEIYEAGSGELLGSQAVSAGANADVFIKLDSRPTGNVNAVLVAGGEVLDTRWIRIDRM